MEFYSFFVTVLQGCFSFLSRIPMGSSSLLGVIVASILLGMIIRSFILTSRWVVFVCGVFFRWFWRSVCAYSLFLLALSLILNIF